MEEKRMNLRAWSRVMILIGLLFLALIALTVITVFLMFLFEGSTLVKITSVFQNILVFIVPAVAAAVMFYKRPFHALGATRGFSWRTLAVIVAVYAVSLPVMNYLVWLNAQMNLPDCMNGVENWMRENEEEAAGITDAILTCHNFWQMIEVLLIVAILTGLGEEVFFRGAMLNMSIEREGGWHHVAVWVTAAVFSAFHFQFFGFVPRLLLGAWLGYLMISTRSLWAPVLAHALNNGMVVIANYLGQKSVINYDALDSVGLPDEGAFPVIATLSAVLTLAIIIWQLPRIKTATEALFSRSYNPADVAD